MQAKTTWQQDSSDPNNAEFFATIRDWWAGLAGKEIQLGQRVIPSTGDVESLNWEPQRFDEQFVITSPEVRGITLYWRKPEVKEERNTTPWKLELDHFNQQLFIYPQSQRETVIRVKLPQLVYQQVKLNQPKAIVSRVGDKTVLLLRDEEQRLDVQVILRPETLEQLRQQ